MTKQKPPIHSEGHHVLQERQKMEAKMAALEALVRNLRDAQARQRMRSASRAGKVPRG